MIRRKQEERGSKTSSLPSHNQHRTNEQTTLKQNRTAVLEPSVITNRLTDRPNHPLALEPIHPSIHPFFKSSLSLSHPPSYYLSIYLSISSLLFFRNPQSAMQCNPSSSSPECRKVERGKGERGKEASLGYSQYVSGRFRIE